MRALLLLALAGCGGSRVGAFSCDAPPFMVTADYAANCDAVRSDVALIRATLDSLNALPAADFDRAFAGVPVLITDLLDLGHSSDVGASDEVVADGRYDSSGIVLSYSGGALLHECLHHVDGPLTHWHDGWAARGWFAADDEYVHHQNSPAFGTDGHGLMTPREP